MADGSAKRRIIARPAAKVQILQEKSLLQRRAVLRQALERYLQLHLAVRLLLRQQEAEGQEREEAVQV